jgi:uncharacterized heparinase superfamily protein
LKFSQIFWRLKYRVFVPKTPIVTSASHLKWLKAWDAPTWCSINQWDGDKEFCFLAEEGIIEGPDSWEVDNKSALWLYNLHYLDCLNAENGHSLEQEKNLVDSWTQANSDFNNIAWAPYCLSLRIVNLVKWSSKNGQLSEKMCTSIARQAEYLMGKIEYPIMGNHLFANGKALVFAGAFLTGDIAHKCLRKGLEILDCEVKEQFLPDGAHFELSPMYHQILMWDMCDLVLLAQISGVEILRERVDGWKSIIIKADIWRAAMLHPDNEVAFFNDSVMGIAPPTSLIDNFLVKLGLTPVKRESTKFHDLHHSGYFAASQAVGHKLLINAAQIEPAYQPGHAHADSLSFELSIFGNRLFVNSGTSMYGVTTEREEQRSTIAHNTLTIDNENSSQVWGGFRVAKRARIVHRKCNMVDGDINIEASHDGYVKSTKGSLHKRKWLSRETSLNITDEIKTDGNAIVRFYLHPSVNVCEVNKQNLTLDLNNKSIFFSVSAGELKVIKCKWYPKFGLSVVNHVIEVTNFDGFVTSQVRWDC